MADIQQKRIFSLTALATALADWFFVVDKSGATEAQKISGADLNAALNHEFFAGLQGGNSGNHKHLTDTELTGLQGLLSGGGGITDKIESPNTTKIIQAENTGHTVTGDISFNDKLLIQDLGTSGNNEDLYIDGLTKEVKSKINIDSVIATVGLTKGRFKKLKDAITAGYKHIMFVEAYNETENIGVTGGTYRLEGAADAYLNMGTFTFGDSSVSTLNIILINLDFRIAYTDDIKVCFNFTSLSVFRANDSAIKNNSNPSALAYCIGGSNTTYTRIFKGCDIHTNSTYSGLEWIGSSVGVFNNCRIIGFGTIMQGNFINCTFVNALTIYMNDLFIGNILLAAATLKSYNADRNTIISDCVGESTSILLNYGSDFYSGCRISNCRFSSISINNTTTALPYSIEIVNTIFTSTTATTLNVKDLTCTNTQFYCNVTAAGNIARFIGCKFGTVADTTKTLIISVINKIQVIACTTGIDINGLGVASEFVANNKF